MEKNKATERPWGYWKLLDEEVKFKLKKLKVTPGECLSYQVHLHRDEHWFVVSGIAKIRIDERIGFLYPGQSINVTAGTKHSIENPGKIPLEIIEIQTGEYLAEDDIERLEDRHGRMNTSNEFDEEPDDNTKPKNNL